MWPRDLKRITTGLLLGIILLILSLVLGSACAHAAVTISGEKIEDFGPLSVCSLTLTMSSIGTTAAMTHRIDGYIVAFETDPGSTAPTDNYDITFNDDLGLDVMGTALNNRDTSTTEITKPIINGDYDGVPTVGLHTFTITNNSNTGATVKTRIFYYRYRED